MNAPAGKVATAAAPSCDHARYEREIEELSHEILERYEEVNTLYRLTDSFLDMFDEDAILARLLSEAARAVRASSGWIAALGGHGEFSGVARFGESASAVPLDRLRPLAERSIAEGRALLRESRTGPRGAAGPTMAIPLPGKIAPIGVLVLARSSGEEPFRSGEQRLASTVASYGASVIENRRLVLAMKDADRVRGEIEIARRIQTGLLPPEDPKVPGLQVAGMCRPAEDIGGDYFGYTHVSPGRFGITIADVSGHSIGAAIGMVMARCLIQSEAHRISSPSRILTRVNDLLCRDLTDPGMFVTVFLAVYEEDSGQFRYTNAGHNPPLVNRAATGTIETLSGGGPGLGIVPDARYQEFAEMLLPGDAVLLYTDGVTEARSGEGEMFGIGRLREAVGASSGRSAREMVEQIVETVTGWRGGPVFADDLTVVAARKE